MKYEYEKETSASTKLTYLLVGGGIGAILALLFAPKSGEELRGDIADVTRKGVEKSKETATLVGEKAGEYYEVTRDKAGELVSAAQDKAGEVYATAQDKASELVAAAQDKAGQVAEKAGEVAEKAKGAVSSASNPFTAAIEAGKDAYTDEKRRNEAKSIVEGRPAVPKALDNK